MVPYCLAGPEGPEEATHTIAVKAEGLPPNIPVPILAELYYTAVANLPTTLEIRRAAQVHTLYWHGLATTDSVPQAPVPTSKPQTIPTQPALTDMFSTPNTATNTVRFGRPKHAIKPGASWGPTKCKGPARRGA